MQGKPGKEGIYLRVTPHETRHWLISVMDIDRWASWTGMRAVYWLLAHKVPGPRNAPDSSESCGMRYRTRRAWDGQKWIAWAVFGIWMNGIQGWLRPEVAEELMVK
ncbi:hypothetical protein C8J57DRAFT_1222901 [Mycena rebaudengoi]|nr:hypothetical protein C8J57DRAFT_1222901 [Mycena rebaudengoi]